MAVAVGLRAAAVGSVTGLEEAAVRALGKLEQVLPKRLRRRVNALQAVSVRLGDAAGPTVDAEALAVIANTCRDELQLRFDYGNREGEASERHVEPYRLVHTRFRWYLLAYDLEREDWRTFRVDRIGPKPRPGRAFRPRPLPSGDAAAYVSQRVSTDVYRLRVRATVHAPASTVSAKLSGVSFRVEEGEPGQSVVHTGADNLETIAWLLGSMGFDFEVHEPPELIDHLRRMSERLGRAAGRESRSDAKGRPSRSARSATTHAEAQSAGASRTTANS
ncbi:helix-turn-helix transcriptional regulator [Cystobacter fuscus]